MAYIRMKAPKDHLSVSVDGIVYKIGPDGEFDAHMAHKQALEAQGYTQKTHRAEIVLDAVVAATTELNERDANLVSDEEDFKALSEDELLAALKADLPQEPVEDLF